MSTIYFKIADNPLFLEMGNFDQTSVNSPRYGVTLAA